MSTSRWGRAIGIGVVGGLIGAVVMGAFAMMAAGTYQKTGVFTPLYHIASSVIDPTAMETSMAEAKAGNLMFFDAAPAGVGLLIHMMVGAFWGALFGVIAAAVALSRGAAPVVGTIYGLGVMVVMAFVGLPLVASVLGGGPPIRDMAQMVGWGTFAAEHAVYGLVVGATWSIAGAPAILAEVAEPQRRTHRRAA